MVKVESSPMETRPDRGVPSSLCTVPSWERNATRFLTPVSSFRMGEERVRNKVLCGAPKVFSSLEIFGNIWASVCENDLQWTTRQWSCSKVARQCTCRAGWPFLPSAPPLSGPHPQSHPRYILQRNMTRQRYITKKNITKILLAGMGTRQQEGEAAHASLKDV